MKNGVCFYFSVDSFFSVKLPTVGIKSRICHVVLISLRGFSVCLCTKATVLLLFGWKHFSSGANNESLWVFKLSLDLPFVARKACVEDILLSFPRLCLPPPFRHERRGRE